MMPDDAGKTPPAATRRWRPPGPWRHRRARYDNARRSMRGSPSGWNPTSTYRDWACSPTGVCRRAILTIMTARAAIVGRKGAVRTAASSTAGMFNRVWAPHVAECLATASAPCLRSASLTARREERAVGDVVMRTPRRKRWTGYAG